MQSLLLTALLDVDVTSQSAGSLDNLMTVSFEKTVIDDEVISRVRRILQGLEISDETYSLDILMEVEHGDNFLVHDSTLDHFMESWQPSVSDWENYETWSGQSCPDLEKKVHGRVQSIISDARQLLSPDTAKELLAYMQRFE